ncbi:MAG: single-stranded DNA-binding protein [Legionellales bacterium RIFCSPHIGHO2_12_FULL_37_14]|nr:MAG: single-stranded DNA-binding protein [Legionellales bacterium RIFCSPHIGHO2_12_FULL_37_14]
MARGINKVILIGNIGADPDARFLPNGSAVTTLSLATTEIWKDKQTGEKNERTEWHRVICFNRLGEIASEYVKKGSRIYIEGSLRTRKWQDAQGQDRYITEIIANEMQLLDSKGSQSYQPQDNIAASFQAPPQQEARPKQNNEPTAEVLNELDDDIPF